MSTGLSDGEIFHRSSPLSYLQFANDAAYKGIFIFHTQQLILELQLNLLLILVNLLMYGIMVIMVD